MATDNNDSGLLGQSFSQLLRLTLVAQITIYRANRLFQSLFRLADGALKLTAQNGSLGDDDDRAG